MTREMKALHSAAQSASFTMVIQIFFRVLTFILNGYILRFISRDMLGVVNVRLLLLNTTIIFLATEAFYRACLSRTLQQNWQQIVNLLWMMVPLGILLSVIFGYIWMFYLENPEPERIPHYQSAVVVYAVAGFVEIFGYPLAILGQLLLCARLKACVEGLSLAARCLVTVLLVTLRPEWGILSFCIAEMCYALTFVLSYHGYFYFIISRRHSAEIPFSTVRDLFPQRLQNKPFVGQEHLLLVISFLKQSTLKQLLTEGERYIMTVFGVLSFADQGIYDVINNLGSLAARFIYLPIEEAHYLFITQSLLRGKAAIRQPQEALELSAKVLSSLLRLVFFVGLTILVFGYSYSFLLLDIYGGKLLSSGPAPSLLRWYCIYVMLLAVNGISEGFKNGTMSQQQLDRYNRTMMLLSLIFLISAWCLTLLLGSVGFILANSFNMTCRIIHSVRYIQRFFDGSKQAPLQGLIPGTAAVVVFVMIFVITAISESIFCCQSGWQMIVNHVAIGSGCLVGLGFVLYRTENELITFVLNIVFRSKQTSVHNKNT